MRRTLPPLNALRAFEAAGRHLSFTAAAEELCVTQGAVSHQVKGLESYLALRLFQRLHQRLKLTEDGAIYMAAIGKALDKIETATADLMADKTNPHDLSISVPPTLCTRWLIPRIQRFKAKYPSLNLTIATGDGPVDFSTNQWDMAVRVGTNEWTGIVKYFLMKEKIVVACHPSLRKGPLPLKKPADLRYHTLLQHTGRPRLWTEWFKAAGIDTIKNENTLGFEHYFMLIEAVLDGLGIALIPKFLIEKELKEGMLVTLFNVPYESPYSYYLLHPTQTRDLFKIRVFSQWLLKECGKIGTNPKKAAVAIRPAL